MIQIQEKKQSMETDWEITWILKLAEKYFKVIIITILKEDNMFIMSER